MDYNKSTNFTGYSPRSQNKDVRTQSVTTEKYNANKTELSQDTHIFEVNSQQNRTRDTTPLGKRDTFGVTRPSDSGAGHQEWMTITKNDQKLYPKSKKYDNLPIYPVEYRDFMFPLADAKRDLENVKPIKKYWDGFNEEGEKWFIEFENGVIINQKHTNFEYFAKKI